MRRAAARGLGFEHRGNLQCPLDLEGRPGVVVQVREWRGGNSAAGLAVEDNQWLGSMAGVTSCSISEEWDCNSNGRWVVRSPAWWAMMVAGGGRCGQLGKKTRGKV